MMRTTANGCAGPGQIHDNRLLESHRLQALEYPADIALHCLLQSMGHVLKTSHGTLRIDQLPADLAAPGLQPLRVPLGIEIIPGPGDVGGAGPAPLR